MALSPRQLFSIRHNRSEYGKILEVPEGYFRDAAIFTTFSLDLKVARYLLVSSCERLGLENIESMSPVKKI